VDNQRQWYKLLRFILNVRANNLLGITCAIGNDVKGDVAALLLDTCREALKRNVDKKFMNPTYPRSDIPIPGQWTLATGYDTKSGPTWLDKGMVFESIKDILEGIYSDVKKGTRHVVWLGFRVSDDETLAIRDTSIPLSDLSTPIEQNPPKVRKASRKTKIKKESQRAGIDRKIKKENSNSQLNVRKSQLFVIRFLLIILANGTQTNSIQNGYRE
jgi:hypothetical protein